MKKLLLILLLITQSSLLSTAFAGGPSSLGQFHATASGCADTVLRIPFSNFDTLGYAADVDSYYVMRYYGSTIIDTTKGAAATNRISPAGGGMYRISYNNASDATPHYGQYNFRIIRKIQGKYWPEIVGTYDVLPKLDTAYVFVNGDKSNYVLAANGLDSDTSFSQVQGIISKFRFDVGDTLVKSGMYAINGDLTNNYNATLKLKMLDLHNTTGSYGMRIQSDVGNALYVTTNAANANAVYLAGQGSGAGLSILGGSVGPGLVVNGGSTSGNGITVQSKHGVGLSIANVDSGTVVDLSTFHGDGIRITSSGDGHFGIRTPNVDTAFANVVWNDSTAKHTARRYTMGDSLLKLGNNSTAGSGGIGDSTIARIDSIRWAVGMPFSISGEKYVDNLHNKLGAYSGSSGDNNNIKDDIAALSLSGNGSEACTLIVRDDGIVPILGARIIIRTLDQTATRIPGLLTDVNGNRIVELDPSPYYVSIMANNYFPLTDTILINRDSTWHFAMTFFNPGAPGSPDLCRVYGWIYDITGAMLSNVKIKAEIPTNYQPIKYGDIIITPFEKSTETDSTGYWQIDLIPNSRLSDPDSKYQFVIEYPSGVVYKSKVAVPDSINWEFR